MRQTQHKAPQRLAVCWALATCLLRPAQAAPIQEVALTPGPSVRPLPTNFLGFSMEKSALNTGRLSPQNHELLAVLKALKGGTLRFGGNTVDELQDPPADAALRNLFSLAAAARWKVIYGLNLGSGTPARAAAEARRVWNLGRPQLLALEVGNEPDLFVMQHLRNEPWTVERYLTEFSAFRQALGDLPLSGPGAGVIYNSTGWTLPFLQQEAPRLQFASAHFYPTVARTEFPAGSPLLPSLENLFSPKLRLGITERFFQPQIQAARQHGLTFRVTETNTAARGGQTGVSDSFAAALWVADWTLRLLLEGVDGLNVQTDLLVADDVYTPLSEQQGKLQLRPMLGGMLLLSALQPGTLGRVVATPEVPQLSACVVRGKRCQVLLVNLGPTLRVQLPGCQRQLTLRAPSLSAQTQITLGGQPLALNRLAKQRAEPCTNPRFLLPAWSATLVDVNPQQWTPTS